MSNFFQSFLPYLAGAGASGLAGQFSALAPFQAAIGAGAGALTNSKNRLAGAAQGFAGGGLGSTLSSGVKNIFSNGSGSLLDKFGSGAMSGLKSFGGSIPGFGGVGTNNPTGAFAKFFTPSSNNGVMPNGGTSGTSGYSFGDRSPLPFSNTAPYSGPGFNSPGGGTPGSNFMDTSSGTGGNTPPSVLAPRTNNDNNANNAMNPMDMFKNMIPGAAVSGIGSLLTPQVTPPDYSAIKTDLLNRGGDPAARAAASGQYMSTLNAPTGASAESGIANAKLINDRQKADAIRQITQQFSANNGSTTGNSAYNDAVTKSNAYYDQNYAAQASQNQFQYDQQPQQFKMAAADALRGMDDTQLNYFAGLANLDIMQIQQKLGIDVASANAIKQIAQTAGELMMEKGLGLNQVNGGTR